MDAPRAARGRPRTPTGRRGADRAAAGAARRRRLRSRRMPSRPARAIAAGSCRCATPCRAAPIPRRSRLRGRRRCCWRRASRRRLHGVAGRRDQGPARRRRRRRSTMASCRRRWRPAAVPWYGQLLQEVITGLDQIAEAHGKMVLGGPGRSVEDLLMLELANAARPRLAHMLVAGRLPSGRALPGTCRPRRLDGDLWLELAAAERAAGL